jgi:hypothetical protein
MRPNNAPPDVQAPVVDQGSRSDVVLAALVGVGAFLFRATAPRDLTNDHYMHLSWSRQVLAGDLPGRDFVDPGMPLAWGLSAIAQWVRPGPLSEIALCAVMFGVVAGLTYAVGRRLTGARTGGATAAVLGVVFVPRLYNFPKLLVPALIVWLVARYVERPRSSGLLWLGAGVAAAVLFRHDLGLYAAIVAPAGVALAHRRQIGRALSSVVTLGASTLVWLLPYVLYVWWSEGLVEHVRRGLEFSRGEQDQLQYDWPVFQSLAAGTSWGIPDATALLYYASWVLVFMGAACLPWRSATGVRDRLPACAASWLFLALYLPIILRYPLNQRLPDIATPLALVGVLVAWTLAGQARQGASGTAPPGIGRPWPVRRLLVSVAGATFLLNAGIVGGFARELEETRIDRGLMGPPSKVRSLLEDGASWPWEKMWPNSGGFPAAIRYLHACTLPDQYLLMTWPSSEYYLFAERRFAAGHTMFLPPDAFTTDRDQQFMLSRLERERPPIALVNRTTQPAFAAAYARVNAYIVDRYVEAARYRHYDDSEIAIMIRRDLRASSAWGDMGWPCGLVPDRSALVTR